MPGLNLNLISKSIRDSILSMKINQNYNSDEIITEYHPSYDTPIDETTPILEEYRENLLQNSEKLNFEEQKNLHFAARFDIGDSWNKEIHRDGYPRQWDSRKSSRKDRERDIYEQINNPSDYLKQLWGWKGTGSPYEIRQDCADYIEYTNRIFGRNTPRDINPPNSSGLNIDNPENIIGAIIRGDNVALSVNPYDSGIKVVSNFNVRDTLAGRIYHRNDETPLGRFGLKAAAIGVSNQILAKTGQLATGVARNVSGLVKEGVRYGISNSVGRLLGGSGSDFDYEIDINAFGASRITNPPGFMDDIMSATGLGRGLNMVAGGTGLDFLMEGDNWATVATSNNDGKYVQLDDDLLVDTTSKNQPNFDLFINPHGKPGREYEDNQNVGWFNRVFRNKKLERKPVSESEYRRLQNDMLVEWTGAINARMIYSLLELNKYSPNYTKKNSRKENRKGEGLEDKGYNALPEFKNNPYINPRISGIPTIAEEDNPNRQSFSRSFGTVTWGESNVQKTDLINEDEEKDERTRREIRQARRRGEENEKPRHSEYIGVKDVHGERIHLIKKIHETDTLMGKTAALFEANKIGTMISRFQKKEERTSFIQSGIHPVHGMSKGRALANKSFITKTEGGYEDPWCRVWTAETQYRNILNAIRPFVENDKHDPGNDGNAISMKKLHKKAEIIRPYLEEFAKYTSLQDSGTPKIAPYKSDFDGTGKYSNHPWDGRKQNRWRYNRNYMFSIENLAWKGLPLEDILCPSQVGSNGGRVMWFSPLNLSFSENVNNQITPTTLIGRGEPMYSFTGNTTREGTLKFSMIVDHSSFHEYMKGRTDMSNEDEFYQSVLRFEAGCEIPEIIQKEKRTKKENLKSEQKVETTTDTVLPEYSEIVKPETIDLVTVYYPNDFSGVNWHRCKEKGNITNEILRNYRRNGGGIETMNYLYAGGGSRTDGKKEAGIGNDYLGNDYGNGYEMDRIKNGSYITLSNVEIPANNSGTYTIKQWGNGTESATGLHFNHTEPKDSNGRNYGKNKFISDFTTNMHVTDEIVYYKTMPINKTEPAKKTDVLPRGAYRNYLSNWDLGNFQLNTKKTKEKLPFDVFYEICMENDKTRPHEKEGDENYNTKENLIKLFKNAKKVEVIGNASPDGYNDEGGDNQLLAKHRAISLALFTIESLGENILIDEEGNNIEWIIKSEPLSKSAPTDKPSDKISKELRNATIKITTKGSGGELIVEEQITDTTTTTDTVQEYTLTTKKSRYDEEMKFYEYIGDRGETDLAWTNVRDRYNKYIPALWSCTPEGFNARLTFLHQCTRSGPTNVAGQNTGGVSNIANLAFGRPPVCILKIGDFIQSKIFIKTIQFQYDDEGISWDLNSEGIGIQPMKVGIDITFTFMGGQDITGAIARLQNAITFNYYSNTSVYDDRADGNKEDLTGIDTSRERGMGYDSATITSTEKVEKVINGVPVKSESPSVKIKDTTSEMNETVQGIFNPFTYRNGIDYKSDWQLKEIDSLKINFPPPTNNLDGYFERLTKKTEEEQKKTRKEIRTERREERRRERQSKNEEVDLDENLVLHRENPNKPKQKKKKCSHVGEMGNDK